MISDSRLRRWLVVLWLSGATLAQAGTATEYQVSYRGLFSGGSEIPIADLQLAATQRRGQGALNEVLLEASSRAYPLVERLFPIRYRLRSWSTGKQARLLGFEHYESTRKVRHRLYLRDESDLGVRRYDPATGAGRRVIAQLEAGLNPAPAIDGQKLVDRLGLLQQVREMDLKVRSEHRFVVTNGRERLIYVVQVEAAQTLDLGGVSLPAWKLRFDGLESGRNGEWEPAHRPVFVWLSRSAGRIPLRADSRHAIGRFRVELKNRSLLEQVAMVSR